jgi:predicted ATP-grasp superfamily ATP-dependent carboligase
MKRPLSLRILVTGAHTTAALATVRSLGASGVTLTTIGESGRFNLARYSRYVSRALTLPCSEERPIAYFEELVRELQRSRYDLLIPMTDSTIAILRAYRERIENVVRVALPPERALAAVFDKELTIKRATENDVAVPRTWCFRSLGEAWDTADALSYPCVVKPRFSRYWDGVGPIVREAVRHVHSAQALREFFSNTRTHPELLLVQERVYGDGVGVFALMKDGMARVVFAHRRVREANPTGGRASLAESIAADDRIVAPALRLLRALRWNGVAMVEFKDPGAPGAPVLMEINGRFWGSLPLAIAAGVDFPLLLVQQAFDMNMAVPLTYRCGLRCRHLKGDVSYVVASLKGRPSNWSGPFPTPLQAIAQITPWPGRWRSYNLSVTDPVPALGEATAFVASEARSLARRLGFL